MLCIQTCTHTYTHTYTHIPIDSVSLENFNTTNYPPFSVQSTMPSPEEVGNNVYWTLAFIC